MFSDQQGEEKKNQSQKLAKAHTCMHKLTKCSAYRATLVSHPRFLHTSEWRNLFLFTFWVDIELFQLAFAAIGQVESPGFLNQYSEAGCRKTLMNEIEKIEKVIKRVNGDKRD